ncbi:MAG: iron ABC transporter permease [Microbacterium sp.]
MTATATVGPASATRVTGRIAGLIVAGTAVFVLCLVSLAVGSRDVSPLDALAALTDGSASTDATVIREMRLPRTILALCVGAALALGGTILQGLARNPLADPGILGINSGAAVAIVLSAAILGGMPASAGIWFAFAGAGVAIVVVYSIAAVGREGATPVKLALSGAAVMALCGSITSAIILGDPDALNELRTWDVGSLAGRYFPVLLQLLPFFVVGTVAALFTGRTLNLLSLGDDLARALGLRLGRSRGILFVIVAILCGAATAACGPIVFVGLMVPHFARLITGPDYRWILGYSLVLGPLLVLACDIVGRILLPAGEIPVGVVIGIIGAPVFILLVRFRRMAQL